MATGGASIPTTISFGDAQYEGTSPDASRRDHQHGFWANGQIPFPATQNASADVNTLDDYEEGTWTPVVTFATAGNLNVVYGTQVGGYTKNGNIVTVTFDIQTTTFTHTTASGDLQITGLPFAAFNTTGRFSLSSLEFGGITKANYTQYGMRSLANSTTLTGVASGSGQATVTVTTADVPTGGTVVLIGQLTYHSAT